MAEFCRDIFPYVLDDPDHPNGQQKFLAFSDHPLSEHELGVLEGGFTSLLVTPGIDLLFTEFEGPIVDAVDALSNIADVEFAGGLMVIVLGDTKKWDKTFGEIKEVMAKYTIITADDFQLTNLIAA